MPVHPIAGGTQALRPHLIVNDAAAAIDYYKKVFAAEEVERFQLDGSDKIMHAELHIAGCTISLSDEFPEMKSKSASTLGGSPVRLTLYCLDVDMVFDRAVKAGARSLEPVADMFWGDRFGRLIDPFGHEWSLATHKEDLTPEQMRERAKVSLQQMKQKKVKAHA